jgi:hypothetical protein
MFATRCARLRTTRSERTAADASNLSEPTSSRRARALAKALRAYPIDDSIDYTEATRLRQTFSSVERLVDWLAKAPTHAQSIREASHQFKIDTAQQLEPEAARLILRAIGIDVGGRPPKISVP